MSRIAVIGTGYVGLTTGAYLAHLGHTVVCADVVESKVARLNRGEIPIVEAGLGELVNQGLGEERLSFVLGAAKAVPGAEFVFLCLPTPQGADGAADLSFVTSAAGEIGAHLEPGAVVVNKSTVPVGSAGLVAQALGRPDVSVVSNPEFLREGTAVHDCLNPDRIVIGGDDTVAVQRVAGLFAKLHAPLVLTDAASAEMIKYASNAFLATKLSFVNAVATVCEKVGADVTEVLTGIGHDRRIGFEYLKPGPGWGGSCFPKDTAALVRIAADHGYDFGFLRGAIEANDAQFDAVAAKIESMAGGSLAGKVVGVFGLAFKAGTDDVRDSPAIAVIERLVGAGARSRPTTRLSTRQSLASKSWATPTTPPRVPTSSPCSRSGPSSPKSTSTRCTKSWLPPGSSTPATFSPQPPCGPSASPTTASAEPLRPPDSPALTRSKRRHKNRPHGRGRIPKITRGPRQWWAMPAFRVAAPGRSRKPPLTPRRIMNGTQARRSCRRIRGAA